LEDEQGLTILGTPHSRCMVKAGGEDALSVRGKARAPHSISVAFEGGEHPAICGIPHSRGVIVAASNDAPAIGGENRALNYASVAAKD